MQVLVSHSYIAASGDGKSKSPEDILASLLKQLGQEQPATLENVKNLKY
jgi:hypothetical protein